MNNIKSIFTEQVRGYIYRVLCAVGLLLAGVGVISNDQLALILGVVIAALNIMPSANTSVKSSKNGKV